MPSVVWYGDGDVAAMTGVPGPKQPTARSHQQLDPSPGVGLCSYAEFPEPLLPSSL